MIQAFGAFISTLGCGILSDRFESKNKMTKAYIGIVSSVIGLFLAAGISLFEGTSFYVSLGFLLLKFLLTQGYMAPTMTMMQSTVPHNLQGNIVSAYLFFLGFAGTFSAISLGFVANYFGAQQNPWIYGKVIFFGSVVGYLLSIPCFWKAGKAYVRETEKKKVGG